MSDTVDITYRISLDENKTEVFDFIFDAENFDLINNTVENPPQWTELEFRQCSHCPLNSEEHKHCPVALQMANIVDRFESTHSIDEVVMEVQMDEKTIRQKTALQRVIASMLDLVFPISGCPKTEHMKPLARFHTPLASEEETVFRVTSMYLLGQYFQSTTSKGGDIEFDGLTRIYEELHILNKSVASRIQHATRSDSTKNAVTLLDMYSTLVPVLLEDQLAEMRGFFKAYIPEGEVVASASTNYLEKAKAFSMDLDSLELTPVDNDIGDEPEWMKEAKGLTGTPSKSDSEEESAVDKILKGSSLSLSLEPLDGSDHKAAS
jgi:hypothetical protein